MSGACSLPYDELPGSVAIDLLQARAVKPRGHLVAGFDRDGGALVVDENLDERRVEPGVQHALPVVDG